MKIPRVVHGRFTLERSYRAAPSRVFAAWANVETKARWFIGPPDSWTASKRQMDFQVGGEELVQGRFANGKVTTFSARYQAIVPDAQLVFVYDMHVGAQHLSVSLATVEFLASEGGTRMVFTEQASFLDGEDGTASREAGTLAHFVRLEDVLA